MFRFKKRLSTALAGLTLLVVAPVDTLGQSSVPPPLPKEMAEQVSDDTGRPVILLQRGEILWGLSTRPAAYGQPIPVLLWLYNPTDKPQGVTSCGDIGWFWSYEIHVFDFSGEYVHSNKEQQLATDPSLMDLPVCGRNVIIYVPPHTSMHGNFSKPAPDFVEDLSAHYSLAPGRYAIARTEKDERGMPVARRASSLQNVLWVEITEP
jgi:hypothetical protein